MATAPTTADIVQHLRLGSLNAAETTEVVLMNESATEVAENFCNRYFSTKTVTRYIDSFPVIHTAPIVLPGGIEAITSINYYDDSDVSQAFTTFRMITHGTTRLFPNIGTEWATDGAVDLASVTIVYTTGQAIGTLTIPAPVKSAILLMVGDLYEHRENTLIDQGISSVSLSMAAERLLTPYKTRIA